MEKICIDKYLDNNYATLIKWQTERLQIARECFCNKVKNCLVCFFLSLFSIRETLHFVKYCFSFVNYTGRLIKNNEPHYEIGFHFDNKDYLIIDDESYFVSFVYNLFKWFHKEDFVAKETASKLNGIIDSLISILDKNIKEIVLDFSSMPASMGETATSIKKQMSGYDLSNLEKFKIYSKRNVALCCYDKKLYFAASGYRLDMPDVIKNNKEIKNAFCEIEKTLNFPIMCHLCEYTKGISDKTNGVVTFSNFAATSQPDQGRRIFSCAEKKIVSEIDRKPGYNPSNAFFIVTKEPCPTCIRLMDTGAKVFYLDDDAMYPYKTIVSISEDRPLQNNDECELFFRLNEAYYMSMNYCLIDKDLKLQNIDLTK